MSALKEVIYSHAAALHQSGQMKSTIYASERTVFIMNMNNTIILRFTVPPEEPGIEGKVSFIANDYDSEYFREENGRIIFTKQHKGMTREKSCRAPNMTFDEVEGLWNRYFEADRKMHHNQKVVLTNEIMPLLDTSLSHLEIKSVDNKVIITQRDIYTGSIITIKFDDTRLRIDSSSNITEDFGPIGMRTNDFKALFSFNNFVSFYFHPTSPFMLVKGKKLSMSGVLGGCVYDEMGETTVIIEEVENGRQEQKDRRRKQKASTAPHGKTKKRPEFKRKRRAT
jgi:hypothetical protein